MEIGERESLCNIFALFILTLAYKLCSSFVKQVDYNILYYVEEFYVSGWRGIVFMKSLATNQSYMWPYSISLDCTSPPSTPPQSIPPQSLMSTPPQRKSTPPFAGTPPPFAGSPNPAPGPSARCPSPSPYGFDDDTQ